jgi:hypothetical protein
MKKLIKQMLLTGFSIGLLGCASTIDTNKVVEIPSPTIGVTDSIAEMQVAEQISGFGCSREVLGILKFGDDAFLNKSGKVAHNPLDRAKEAAMFNALRGAKKTNPNTDILINPTYTIAINDPLILPFLVTDVCVKVTGNRGIIKGYKAAETITREAIVAKPQEESSSFWSWFWFGAFFTKK